MRLGVYHAVKRVDCKLSSLSCLEEEKNINDTVVSGYEKHLALACIIAAN